MDKGEAVHRYTESGSGQIAAMKNINGRQLDTVFVLIIFLIFTISVYMVLSLGGSIYKNLAEVSSEDYNEQTCLKYIWTKVKNGDRDQAVGIIDFHGLPALCIEEEYDEIRYQTLIYLYDGWVRELFFEAGLEFAPKDGMQIVEAESLTFERLDDKLIKVVSGTEFLCISPRGNPS